MSNLALGVVEGDTVRHRIEPDGSHWPKLRADATRLQAECEARALSGKQLPRQLEPPGFGQDTLRMSFMHLLWDEAPDAWPDLRRCALPAYIAAHDHEKAQLYRTELKGGAPLTRRVREFSPKCMHELAYALIAWGVRWHLTDDWCEQHALMTLNYWHALPDREGPAPFSLGWGGAVPREYATWPQTRRVRRVLENEPVPWQLPYKGEREHLRWLVWYQCLGHSDHKVMNCIKKEEAARIENEAAACITARPGAYLEVSSVYPALKRAARALGLSIRPGKRGRMRRETAYL